MFQIGFKLFYQEFKNNFYSLTFNILLCILIAGIAVLNHKDYAISGLVAVMLFIYAQTICIKDLEKSIGFDYSNGLFEWFLANNFSKTKESNLHSFNEYFWSKAFAYGIFFLPTTIFLIGLFLVIKDFKFETILYFSICLTINILQVILLGLAASILNVSNKKNFFILLYILPLMIPGFIFACAILLNSKSINSYNLIIANLGFLLINCGMIFLLNNFLRNKFL